MGSGGMVVMDADTCIVDIAKFFLTFTQKESCGKCTFCRVGTTRLLEILERIAAGKGAMDDLDKLADPFRKSERPSPCVDWARPPQIPSLRRSNISETNTKNTLKTKSAGRASAKTD